MYRWYIIAVAFLPNPKHAFTRTHLLGHEQRPLHTAHSPRNPLRAKNALKRTLHWNIPLLRWILKDSIVFEFVHERQSKILSD